MDHIFWQDSYISVLTDWVEASSHKHHMLQMFISKTCVSDLHIEDQYVSGNYIIVDSDIMHELRPENKVDCFLLFDASSTAVDRFREDYLQGQEWAILPVQYAHSQFLEFCHCPDDLHHKAFSVALFSELSISCQQRMNYDPRVLATISMFRQYKDLEASIEKIAKSIYLSPSRLSHLFKEETGVSLKSYMVMYRLQKAYKLIFQGLSVTEAAIEAGFYSASHLADTNRKWMGRNISNVLKNSG